MAIINSIILGRASGSIGNVSLSTRKGRVIARQKPTIVANPRTTQQLNQRKKISAVNVAWYFIGNAIKSGITQLVGYGSQFNTYVSKNADIFAGKTFTKETAVVSDFANSWASIGSAPQIAYTVDEALDNRVVLLVNGSILANYVKVGDKFRILAGKAQGSTFSTSETTVTSAHLNQGENLVTFNDLDLNDAGVLHLAFWVESADGRFSTSSKILEV